MEAGGLNYPSPASEVTEPLPTRSLPNEVNMEKQTSPAMSPRRPRPTVAVKRNREPPRNSEGQICCDHPDCKSTAPVFRRPCEWNKHMDKHDRPYKCMEPECNKMPGFTYSGGLLRHQREVHKMHTPAKRLMCPYPDCRRSTGNGFARHENLKEHIRRLHRGIDPIIQDRDDSSSGPSGQSGQSDQSGQSTQDQDGLAVPIDDRRLKKRSWTANGPGSEMPESMDVISLQEEIAHLRKQNEMKDVRLSELEQLVEELQRQLSQPYMRKVSH
ncbi:hypothetical protein KEM56_007697 [Ascosphaera pollenicola]|nr:hypothetical protein KEM56_007697 [Ascosphaera pollenicola]